MKINKKLLGLMQKLVLDEIDRIKKSTPVGYVEDLQSLEIIISKEIK